MTTFLERLDAACEARQSLVCVGLDPDPALMPVEDVFSFNKAIVDVTHDLVCAYKPNLAFYEALGLDGLRALEQTIQHIRKVAPTVILIGDAKRGDVTNTAAAYAKAMFEVWDFDATTVNAYGGRDSVEPFFKYREKGVLIWCRSSNPGAGDFQDVSLSLGNATKAFYQHIASSAGQWNINKNIGLVAGATYPSELGIIRKICPELPILAPGIGSQAGDLEQSVRLGVDDRGRRAMINSSRGIIYASRGRDFAEAARNATIKLRDAINATLASEGRGW
ncbi:MAG: orotidine-5'-phosphate decarboxylase [Dehalococcoidia bacterium]|nr:orotidine-5'-phosphate decarboxylase [Dehalococcoidia bacterium]